MVLTCLSFIPNYRLSSKDSSYIIQKTMALCSQVHSVQLSFSRYLRWYPVQYERCCPPAPASLTLIEVPPPLLLPIFSVNQSQLEREIYIAPRRRKSYRTLPPAGLCLNLFNGQRQCSRDQSCILMVYSTVTSSCIARFGIARQYLTSHTFKVKLAGLRMNDG